MEKKQTLIKLKDNTIILNNNNNENFFFSNFISKIKSNLTSQINSNKIHIEFLETENKKYFIIKIFYLKQTEFNFFNTEMIFYIKLNCLFPETYPTIKCMSNFIFPSLFDGRNFFNEIVFNNNINSLITNEIPNMIKKYVNNLKSKIYSFIGEYIIGYVYDINSDFLMNETNLVYNKVKIDNFNDVIIVMTQICLLFFELFDETNFEYYKLIEFYEIRNFNDIKINHDSKFIIINLNLENNNIITKKIVFDNNVILKEFYENLNKRIKIIKSFFEIYKKGNNENDINILINTIEYKEKNLLILNNNTEIVEYYQKLIELLSENNDERYEFYIKKFQKLLENFK